MRAPVVSMARRVFTLALLLAALASLAAIQRPPAPLVTAAATGAAKPFRHGEHVAQEWLDAKVPEVWRDCRGCHRFDAQNLVSSPQQQCASCHGAGLAPAPGWPADLQRFRSRTGGAFRHHTHAVLECRQCHGAIGQAFLLDDFDIRTGPGQCAKCHEEGRLDSLDALRFFDTKAGDDARALGLEAYAKKLVAAFAGPTGGINTQPLPAGGDFDHGDHCGVVEAGGSVGLGSLLRCVDCHTNIPQAGARETGTGRIPTDKCGSCHRSENAPARAAAGDKKPQRRLWSLGTFAHADHYAFLAGQKQKKPGVCSDDAYAKIENGCDACHESDAKALGRPDADFPFRGGFSKNRYVDCQECHDVPGWQTGETTAAPLHASTGRSGWDRCTSCHVFGEPDMARVRVTTQVERLAGRTFVFPANVHPDITQKGITRSEQRGRATVQECKTCHRARVPELPSRQRKSQFRHDTHLPAAPKPEDCTACHPNAATAGRSAELAGADRRTYSLARCSDCHWGDVVGEELTAGETRETMAAQQKACVEFPHGPHVTAAKLSCLQCHAPAAEGRAIETLPGALLCNQCHDHEPGQEGEPKVEGLFDGGATSCARCHHEARAQDAARVAVVPRIGASAADPRYAVDQTTFPGFADAQFHPLGGNCTECHKANESKGRLVEVFTPVGSGDRLFATLNVSVHPPDQPQKTPADCLRCHWKPVGKWQDAVNTSAGSEDDKKLRRRPGSAETRKLFGNDNEGYPGSRARG
ncbi:MAG TPA: cytochrome c3 family protein [Planctomycetota bacterium]